MSGLIDHIRELAEPLGGVAVKRMFGGWGLFRHGRMFALIAGETVYIKADADNAAAFEAEGLEPFSYETSGGRRQSIAYRRMPERGLDDPEDFALWARLGLAAAERAAERAPPRRKRSPRALPPVD